MQVAYSVNAQGGLYEKLKSKTTLPSVATGSV
jgi:hypothetical protein